MAEVEHIEQVSKIEYLPWKFSESIGLAGGVANQEFLVRWLPGHSIAPKNR